MDTRRLKYFMAIYDSRSITKAAIECGVAQPALSQQLAVLEAELKAKLFVRSAQGVIPTAAGHLLQRRAKGLLWQVDQLSAELRHETGDYCERVSIGLPTTVTAAIGMKLIRQIHDRHPGISIQLIEGRGDISLGEQLMESRNTHSLSEMVETFRVCAAVVFSNTARMSLRHEFLVAEDLNCIAPAAWQLPPLLELSQLQTLPLILTSRPHNIRVQVDAFYARMGLLPRIAAEADSVTILRQAVLEGFGASFLPSGLFSDTDRTCISTSKTAIGLSRSLFLCTRDGRPMSAAETTVIDCLRDLLMEK